MSLDIGKLVGYLGIDKTQWDKGLGDAQREWKSFGGGIATAAAAMGAAAAVAFTGALLAEMHHQKIGGKIAAQFGETSREAGRYGHLAGKIYADAFGESLEEVGNALGKVLRAPELIPRGTDEEIKRVTEQALTLADVFDQDINRVVAAAQQLIRNGLAKDAQAAFDIITRGMQLGVDKSEDLLDTFNEYSTEFRALGLSGEQALGLLQQGLRAGARDSDTVADALKEFAIRSKDASTTSMEGFRKLGLNGAQMTKIFARGGPQAANGLSLVLNRLRAMKDPVAQNAAAVALFGTKAEDLDRALLSLDPSTAVQALGQVKGAIDRAGEAAYNNAATNLESFKRKAVEAFVTTLGGKVIPAVSRAAAWLNENFGPALKAVAGWVQRNQEWLGPLAVSLGTFAGALVVVNAAMRVWAAVTAVMTAAQLALDAALAANPIGLIVLAIAALVAGLIYAYHHSEGFRKVVDATWSGIKTVVGAVVGWFLSYVWPYMKAVWTGIATVALWLWRNVIVPVSVGIYTAFQYVMRVARSFGALFVWLGKQVVAPIIGGWLIMFRAVGAAATWLWQNALAPAFRGVAAVATWLWGTVINPVFTAIMGIVRKVGGVFRSVFGAISGFIASAFNRAVAIGKGAINGLIDMLNKATGFINKHLVGNLNKVPGVDFPTIPALPRLAAGGTVHPTAGGRPVVMGDGGQVEYGMPHSKLMQLLRMAGGAFGGAGGGVLTLILRGDGILRGIRETVRIQGGDAETVLVGG